MKEIVAVIFGFGLLCNALLFVPQVLAVCAQENRRGNFSGYIWRFQRPAGDRRRAWNLSERYVIDCGDGGELSQLRVGNGV